MKILHVNNIANVGPLLVKGLNELGQEAEFYDLPRPGSNSNIVGKIVRAPLRLYEFIKLNKYIKDKKFDIVHIHFASQGIAGILGGYPYTLHVHGGDVHNNFKVPIVSQITKLSINKAERVIYSTPELEKPVKQFRPDAVFLPNPIETERYSMGLPPKKNNSKKKIFLFSRLDPIKKVGMAFEAFRVIKQDYQDIEFFALKIGSLYDHFRSEFGDIVTFVDKIPYSRVPSFLASCDIVVGQLGLGAIGMSELEVMASGTPLITHFKYNRVYENPPPLVSVENSKELALAVSRLIRDKSGLVDLSHKGKDWVRQNHDYKIVAKKLLNAYKRKNKNTNN